MSLGHARSTRCVLEQPVEQADRHVLFHHQAMTEPISERQRSQGTNCVHEQRVRAVERMDEPALRGCRPASRLYGATDTERKLVEAQLPVARVDAAFAHQTPQRAVRAHVVEAVVVHARVGEMRRHPLDRASASELEEFRFARRVEL
jgi:hypothetical protein